MKTRTPRKATRPACRVALVTGAARGIGLAITQRLLAQGHKVALLDIDGDGLARAHEALDAPDQTMTLTCDVADAEAVRASMARVDAQYGGLDWLVNNAGVAVFKPVERTRPEEWDRVIAVNLNGPFYCTLAALPMLERSDAAAIVNIASISGLRASTLRVAYGTSKAGIAHLTRQLAAELGNRGIRVNAIAPGPVDTAMAKAVHSAEIRRDYHDAIPLNRYGSEDEIAAGVLFLLSSDASYVNGQVLAVDGGFDATGIGLSTLRSAD
jgi:NAD(P)-dependent dehydrogenase (short-subunit alcohol dehydrogenase family)